MNHPCEICIDFIQKFPKHKSLEDAKLTEYTLENLYPNTLYHVWIAAKSRRGEGAATPKLAVRTDQYGRPIIVVVIVAVVASVVIIVIEGSYPCKLYLVKIIVVALYIMK